MEPVAGLVRFTLRALPARLAAGSPLLPGGADTPFPELLVLLAVLLGGAGILAGTRLWRRRRDHVRAERYRARARERYEARRERAEETARVEAARPASPEAILVLDLVQSTELIREHGDEFFRDLLRRIESSFIPVARAHGTRCVDGHGDGLLFCFEDPAAAVAAVHGIYARLPALNAGMPAGVEIAFRAALHVGPTFTDSRGNRSGLAVLKTVRLGGAMEALHGRGAGRNSLVLSEEALAAVGSAGSSATLLGRIPMRGFPGTHPVYALDVPAA